MKFQWLSKPITIKWVADWILLPIWWLFDRVIPKQKNNWAFFVHPFKTSQLVENSRAVFEKVKSDPSCIKYIFTRGRNEDLQFADCINVRVVEIQSVVGLFALARCSVFFITNAITLDVSWRWSQGRFTLVRPSLRNRIIINLWHGIPLKKLFSLANTEQAKRAESVKFRRLERAYYQGLVASSDIDKYAMSAAFYPINPSSVWITGLPRNDYLCCPESELSKFFRDDLEKLRLKLGNRRLVVYAPTYREVDSIDSYCYQFSEDEILRLKKVLKDHSAVLGVRLHYYRKGEALFNIEKYIDDELIYDLGHRDFAEASPIVREMSLLITDYSSLYFDALYLNKPVIGFVYDLENYMLRQNGLLYDMRMAFPGPLAKNFDDLITALERELSNSTLSINAQYQMSRSMFFKYFDDNNSQRVIDRVHALQKGDKSNDEYK